MKNKMNQFFKTNYKEVIIFGMTFILFLIPLLSMYPGIIPYDGHNQWNQIESGVITNNHPFLSTFLWWILSRIWFSPTTLPIFQILLVSMIWTYACHIFKGKENFRRQIIYTIIISLIPIIFSYAITTWKDIIYSYMLLLIALMIYVGINKKFDYSYHELFVVNLALVLTASYRYNGKIAIVILMLMLLILFIKNKISKKKIVVGFIMFVTISVLFKIPEKLICQPQNQPFACDYIMYLLAPLIKEDKISDSKDLEIISEIYPIEKIKEEYNPYCINGMSLSKNYDKDKSLEYQKETMKILIKYATRNPFPIIEHYLKSDNLLIGFFLRDGYVYVFPFNHWDDSFTGNFDSETEPILNGGYNFYLNLINMSAKIKIGKYFYMPANIMYISVILIWLYCRKRKDNKYFLVLLPMISNTLSLLPISIAQDLRYVYINYLTLFLMVIPILLFRRDYNQITTKNKSKKNARTLIIVPAYNEELNIKKTIEDITSKTEFDYIIVNDCSKDNTLKVCKENKLNYLSLPVNFGLTSGIQLGMKYALENNYDIAVQFDGDGQHQAEYLNHLVKEVENGNCDIAIGSRFVNKKKSKSFRMIGSRIISWCIKFTTGQEIKDPTSGMRAYSKEIIEEFVKDSSLTPEPDTLAYLIRKGNIVKEVQVEMKEREFGESYLKPLKAAEYMINMVSAILFFRNFQKL